MKTIYDIPTLYTQEDLERVVDELGILPYFENDIPGFSVEEHCDPRYYTDNIDGPWEWKGPVITNTQCAYGKYFNKKAGFISKEWFADFMNYRRDGYDFDARFNDHLATNNQKTMFELLDQVPSMLSINMREQLGYKKGQGETIVNQLFMMGYITTSNFEYRMNRYGEPYGWGIARYATIEQYYGEDYVYQAYERTPDESYQRLLAHLKQICPHTPEKDLKKLLG